MKIHLPRILNHSIDNFCIKMTKVAVVTGSNKGIGFAVVKGLFGKFDGDIFLTARSEERGLAAVEELKKVSLFSSHSKIFLKIIIIKPELLL